MPSPLPRGTATDFIKVDWTLWGRQEWAKWPGSERYTGGQDTRAWWQAYGYRVEDHSTSRQGNKLKWICADCFARGFKKKSDFCFICSTGVSAKKHLRDFHGIQAPNDAACRSGGLLFRRECMACAVPMAISKTRRLADVESILLESILIERLVNRI
ncbi:hypothetical protein V2A60_008673 [Cordyceps javanica]